MLRLAVFIDAGYLWKQLCKALVPEDEGYRRSNVDLNFSNFHAALIEYVKTTFPDIPLLRCYWYDGALADGNPSSDHNKVALLNDFKLRLGNRVAETSDGKTRQKGVDGLIIADLIALAQNKVLSHALLISGDGDMVPGVGVAQALGVRIHLIAVHNENATSPQLKMEADYFELWQEDKIRKFAQARNISQQPATKTTACSGSHSTAKALSPVTPANTEEAEILPTSPFTFFGKTVPLAEFFESLSNDEKEAITPTSYIPYDIDRRLIRLGYEYNDCKPLTEEEKRALRNSLKELAQQFR